MAADDAASSKSLGTALEAANHQVKLCDGADGVRQQVEAFRPDLVIVDLPNGDRRLVTAVVRRLQASYRPLLLGILDGPEQRVPALEAGADACIEHPFSTADVEVHVRALLRRSRWLDHSVHQLGGLVVDEAAHIASYDDQPLELSAKEFALLALLIDHSGTVLSKRTLLDHIWGFDAYDENLVEVHVSALRRRLPDGAKRMIHTIRGVGYVLRDDEPQDRPA